MNTSQHNIITSNSLTSVSFVTQAEETKLYLIRKEKKVAFGSRSRVFIRRSKFSVKPANGRAWHEEVSSYKLRSKRERFCEREIF